MGPWIVGALVLFSASFVSAQPKVAAPGACGEVVTVATHDRTTTRYALASPSATGSGWVR